MLCQKKLNLRRNIMMGGYAGLAGGGNDFFYAVKQLFAQLMLFFQTPAGWAAMGVVVVLFMVFNKR